MSKFGLKLKREGTFMIKTKTSFQVQNLLLSVALLLSTFSVANGAAGSYVFADPTGFGSMTVGGSRSINFLGDGDLTANLLYQGSEIALETTVLNFGQAGTSNPSWMGGSRSMFNFDYDGSASGGAKEFVKIEFVFSRLLIPSSYMLFTDFDSEEGLAIAAFDASNNLIPYSSFTFARVDGEQPGGASLTTPNWLDQNPTIGWQTGNDGWVGTSAVSGYIVDQIDDDANDPGVYLQSSVAISRVVFYYNAETDTTGGNNMRFNFAAVPEPGSMCVFSALLVGGAIASRRRKRICGS